MVSLVFMVDWFHKPFRRGDGKSLTGELFFSFYPQIGADYFWENGGSRGGAGSAERKRPEGGI